MKNTEFYKGDSVRFLNETGSGKVKGILSDGMVMVETEDGFEYPVHSNQLVIVAKAARNEIVAPIIPEPPVENKFIKSSVSEFPLETRKTDDRLRISLAFVPMEPDANQADAKQVPVSDVKLGMHLINDSEYDVLFQVFKTDDTGTRSVGHGIIEAGYIEELHAFNRDGLNSLKKISVQAIFAGRFGMRQRSPLEKVLKFEPFVFFIQENFAITDYFEEPALLFDLINEFGFGEDAIRKLDELQQVLSNKEIPDADASSKYQARKKPEIIEVDLHINVLLDNVKGLSNSEILEYQMQHFHKMLTDAMFKKAGRVIFIHGIGNGTLRDKLRESLKTQYKLIFQDASFQEYGFGATLVFLNTKLLDR